MTLRFYMLQPDTIFQARVNEPSAVTYPVQDVAFDAVATGAYGDIKPGMTVLFGSAYGLDDYGRNRIRAAATSTFLKIGRSSIGTHDGEIVVTDNAYITVINDYRVWSKIPYIDGDDNAAMYKDADIEVGTNTTTPPPVANTGPPAAGTIDSGTGKLAISLPPGGVNESFATAFGAAIASYAWVLPTGVAFTFGSVATDGAIQVAADPGFHWIELTVTDDNGKTHTTRTFIYARDPGEDDTIGASQILEHRITRHGQTLSVKVTQPIAETVYRDGTICLLMDGEPESQATRRNILFWGWAQIDPASIQATPEATLSETTIKCVDVAGRLDTLPGFSQALYNDVKREDVNPEITWAYFENPDWDNLLHYIIHWHSTAIELTDWQNTGVGSSFPFTVREAGGSSLFDQMNTQCESLCPAHYFTCDRQGMLACPVDPMLQEVGDRTATVQANIPVSNWSKIKYTHQRPPRTHWLDDSAILANGIVVNAIFSHSPGDAPGQGEMRATHGEQISPSQVILNQVTGHRYARMNAPESLFNITQTQDQDNLIDPAAMEWTTLTITAALAAERGLTFTTERGLVSEMSIRYKADKEAVTRTITLLWERETVGLPAVTVIPPEIPPADDYEPVPSEDWTPPDLDDDVYGGSPEAYFMWNYDELFRTWDISVPSPVWEKVYDEDASAADGITYIFEVQSVLYSATKCGGYMLTDVGLHWCADLMAAAPLVWTEVLTNIETQAQEEAPTPDLNVITSFTTWGSHPEYVICMVSSDGTNTGLGDYKHIYTYHSHDYGATWKQVDAGTVQAEQIYSGSAPGDGYRSYCFCALKSLQMYRGEAGHVYAHRSSYRLGLQQAGTVFVSEDAGETWVRRDQEILDQYANEENGGLRHPYPDLTSLCYCCGDGFGISARGNMEASTDEFVTTNLIVERNTFPVGYGGVPNCYIGNKDPFRNDHIICFLTDTAGGSPYNAHVMETTDAGVSWHRLGSDVWETGNRLYPNQNHPSLAWSDMDGWPGNPDWWATMRSFGTDTDAPLFYTTQDNFATRDDKSGNLEALVGHDSWKSSLNGGSFALPKVGPNT